jgi:putative (di)nucleoside polyphosphate hydrolase
MPQEFSKLPYRPCVGIVLLNKQGLVWIGRRIAKWEGDTSPSLWQMPQGGIDEGENPRQAAMRELEEETGTRHAEIIAECDQWLTYDLPKEALGIGLKGKFRGQTQKWFAMKFLGDDADINIDAPMGAKAEFDDWKWVPLEETVKRIVEFKRPIYQELVKEFSRLAKG